MSVLGNSRLYQLATPPIIPGDSNNTNTQASLRHKIPLTSATQETSTTTAVTIAGGSSNFSVTTQAYTLASAATSSFTINNSHISSVNNLQATIVDYSGNVVTNGIPLVMLDGITDGAVTVNVVNIHGANALAGTLTIHFVVTTG